MPTTTNTQQHEGISYPVYPTQDVQWHTWSIESAARTSEAITMIRVVRIAPDAPFDSLYKLTRTARREFTQIAEKTGALVVPYSLGFSSIPFGELSFQENEVTQHTLLPDGMALVAQVAVVQHTHPIHERPELAEHIIQGVRSYERQAAGHPHWVDLHTMDADPEAELLKQFTFGRTHPEGDSAVEPTLFFTDIDHYIAK